MGISRTILITGSTDGIGRHAALSLATAHPNDYRIIIHGRSKQRCTETLEWFSKKMDGKSTISEWVVGDFDDLSTVNEMANDLMNRFTDLNVVICNAGVLNKNRVLTKNGLEQTFQVNHLAHFLLINKIRPLLERNAPSRLIFCSSICHSWEPIDWNDLMAEKGYEKYKQYSQSKLMNHLYAFALHRRFKDAKLKISSIPMEPGVIDTKLSRNGDYQGCPIERGSRCESFLAEAADLAADSGLYFNSSCCQKKADSKAYDEKSQERLWDVSVKLLKENGFDA